MSCIAVLSVTSEIESDSFPLQVWLFDEYKEVIYNGGGGGGRSGDDGDGGGSSRGIGGLIGEVILAV